MDRTGHHCKMVSKTDENEIMRIDVKIAPLTILLIQTHEGWLNYAQGGGRGRINKHKTTLNVL